MLTWEHCMNLQMRKPQTLHVLCAQWGVFLLFAFCVLAMTISVALFFPETKVSLQPIMSICMVSVSQSLMQVKPFASIHYMTFMALH